MAGYIFLIIELLFLFIIQNYHILIKITNLNYLNIFIIIYLDHFRTCLQNYFLAVRKKLLKKLIQMYVELKIFYLYINNKYHYWYKIFIIIFCIYKLFQYIIYYHHSFRLMFGQQVSSFIVWSLAHIHSKQPTCKQSTRMIIYYVNKLIYNFYIYKIYN